MHKSTNPDDYQHTPQPVAAMPKDFAGGAYIAPHSHPRSQLAWAASGVMTVTAGHDTWIVPPQRAVWIPAGTIHEIRMSGGPVAMRSLYIDATTAESAGTSCKVILMSRLLRELVLEMADAPLEGAADTRFAAIAALILDEITRGEAQQLRLPMPHDPRLRALCTALLAAPERGDTLDDWSQTAGASSRTLARLFAREVGMSFREWRGQARLAAALARLAQGADIAHIAATTGYRSPSAFTAMFRKTLGKAPREYFAG
jgi:AraC-like DNA-binding protein/mannose-6-phosphate isomerase-like protein (cupin superfamily)